MVKHKMNISIIDLVYIAYIIRLVTGKSLYGIVSELLMGGGSITDKVLGFAMDVFQRIEDEGLEIAVNAAVVTYVKTKLVRPAIGKKRILDMGFATLSI